MSYYFSERRGRKRGEGNTESEIQRTRYIERDTEREIHRGRYREGDRER